MTDLISRDSVKRIIDPRLNSTTSSLENQRLYSIYCEINQLPSLNLEDIEELQDQLSAQEFEVEMLKFKAAKYKALFFHKEKLEEKLEKQYRENANAIIGDFDGCCHESNRGKAIFRSLKDMFHEGLLTEQEYEECNV